jgi:hypothetical protein
LTFIGLAVAFVSTLVIDGVILDSRSRSAGGSPSSVPSADAAFTVNRDEAHRGAVGEKSGIARLLRRRGRSLLGAVETAEAGGRLLGDDEPDEAHGTLAERGDVPSVSAHGSEAVPNRQREERSLSAELIERGEDLKGKVSMERTTIEHNGRQVAQEHMLKSYTDAARSWGADAGLSTEPPPVGFSPTGQPVAQRKQLEDWIGECVGRLSARAQQAESASPTPSPTDAERIEREVVGELHTDQAESVGPELRAWLDHERERGDEFIGSINKQKRRLAGESSFLDSFSMFGTPDPDAMLRRLTGRAATWSVKVQRRLAAELPSRVDAFDGKPPRANPDPTQGDFDRLADYVERRLDVLKAILGQSD